MNLPDATDRDIARFNLERNIIVEAGAGTGKTTLLIDRILFLLLGKRGADTGLEVTEIVALTFTEKAAAEIKFRLSQRLHDIVSYLQNQPMTTAQRDSAQTTITEINSQFGRDKEQVLALSQRALSDLERAQIGTIHSFCAHLLRLYPMQAGIDPEFRVDAKEEALEEIFELEWAQWLDIELGVAPPHPEQWKRVLAKSKLEDLRDVARGLISSRVAGDISGSSREVRRQLNDLAKRAYAVVQNRPKPRGGILKYIEWMISQFQGAAAAVDGKDYKVRVCPSQSEPKWPSNWDTNDQEEYESLARVAGKLDPDAEAIFCDVHEILKPILMRFRNSYRRSGWITFDGLLIAARDLVRQRPDVRLEIKQRFKAILIDEFQDTDPVQGELLMFLGEKLSTSAKIWNKIELGSGRLFIVGDPKQSIYRFRGADIAAVESFSRYLEAQGAVRCALKTNFRSSRAIINTVNRVFGNVMRPERGRQPAYSSILPMPGVKQQADPVWHEIISSENNEEMSADAGRRVEASWIAQWIKTGRGDWKYRDIAIVLRSTSPFSVYLEALKRADIPYVVEGEKYFYGTQEVIDFLNLLRVIDDPTDRIALVGLLRSPLCALEDRVIHKLARSGQIDYRKRVPIVDSFYSMLRRFHKSAGRVSLAELIRDLLHDSYLIEFCSHAYHHQQTASNLLKFGRLAAEASEEGATLKDFIQMISRSQRELLAEGESPLADEDYNAVRLLTIHKSKGLEYPVVILPNLASPTPTRPSDEAVRHSWAGGLMGLRMKQAGFQNAAMALLQEEESLRQRQEEVRVLYVAMTRPKEQLFLLSRGVRRGSSHAKLLDQADCINRVGMNFQDDVDADAPASGRRRRWNPPDAKQLAALWKKRTQQKISFEAESLFVHPSALHAKTENKRPQAHSPYALDPVFLGSLCHAVLERWDYTSNRPLYARDESLAALTHACAKRVSSQRPMERIEEHREVCFDLITRFLRSPQARELAESEIIGREVPFLFEQRGKVVRGVMDVLYRHNGQCIIGDYKTDVVAGMDVEEMSKRYARQGALYVEAVKKVLKERGAQFKVIFLRKR